MEKWRQAVQKLEELKTSQASSKESQRLPGPPATVDLTGILSPGNVDLADLCCCGCGDFAGKSHHRCTSTNKFVLGTCLTGDPVGDGICVSCFEINNYFL